MSHSKIIPSDNAYLEDLWETGPARTAKDQVQALMESEGWKRLIEARDARLRSEQRLAMSAAPKPDQEPRHERMIGRWAGLASLEGLAQGIVRYGDEAEAKVAA